MEARTGPSEATAESRAGAAAIVFVVLFAIAAVVIPAPPSSGDSAEEIQRFFAEHGDGVRGSTYGIVIAGVFFLVFLAGLRSLLSRTSSRVVGDVAFGGGLTLSAMALMSMVVNLSLADNARGLNPDSVASVYGLTAYYPPVVVGAVIALAGATALASLRDGSLPRWAGWVSLAYVGYQLFESMTIYGTDGAFEPSGPVNAIGTLLFLPWALCVGIAMLRRRDV